MAMSRQTKYGIGALAAAALAAGALSGCSGVAAGSSASGVTQVTPAAGSASALPVGSTTVGEGTGGVAGTATNTGTGAGTGDGNASSANGVTTGTGTGTGTGSGTTSNGSSNHTTLPVCAPSGLAATVFVVNGSQGMGHELLNISLININDPTCTLYGYPGFQLRGEDSSDQPGADQPTTTLRDTGIPKTLITLAPTQEASTTARIDDDIPAGGEPVTGACEPDSYYLGITPPNDTSQVVQRINGPMATTGITVCEHGTLDVLPFVAGSVGPNQ